jgi:acetolactate synthase-1/2/3 large subunit
VVINDNSSFYNDEQHQAEVAEHRRRPTENSWIGMRMAEPEIDLAALARSYGCWATGPITNPDLLRGVLGVARDRALAGEVAVVQVRTDPNDA